MADNDLKVEVLEILKKMDLRMDRMEYILNKISNKLSKALMEKSRY